MELKENSTQKKNPWKTNEECKETLFDSLVKEYLKKNNLDRSQLTREDLVSIFNTAQQEVKKDFVEKPLDDNNNNDIKEKVSNEVKDEDEEEVDYDGITFFAGLDINHPIIKRLRFLQARNSYTEVDENVIGSELYVDDWEQDMGLFRLVKILFGLYDFRTTCKIEYETEEELFEKLIPEIYPSPAYTEDYIIHSALKCFYNNKEEYPYEYLTEISKKFELDGVLKRREEKLRYMN